MRIATSSVEAIKRTARWAGAMIFAVVLTYASGFMSTAPNVHAQATLKIAAVVNDELISIYDLSQRISMIIKFSNLPNNQETQRGIAPDVLRRLIIEKLHLQEAERLEIEVTDSQIENAIAGIEKNNDLPPGGMDRFLQNNGIDPESLRSQVRAEQAWIQVIRTLFGRQVTISNEEVNDVVQKMQEETGKPEYLLAEIFLAYDEKPPAEVQEIAANLHQQLLTGASWPQIAQNFSESASAINGGDLGWNTVSDLPSVIGQTVSKLDPGDISAPITTDDGIYLMLVRDRRTAQGIGPEQSDVIVGIQQLHLNIPSDADAQTVANIEAHTESLAKGAENCQALERVAASEGSELSGFLGEVKLSQLNSKFREMVEPLEPNQISQPLRTQDGVIILMVCSRSAKQENDPLAEARNRIRQRLLNEGLGRRAQQHEDKLRRQAFIDIRL